MSAYLETTHRNIIWFKRAENEGELQMVPPFQRNPVWTEKQKSYLIDTVLRGYPAPEIYMQDVIEPSGKQTHIVVDGQQRIRACLEFLEGKFELDSKQSPDFADMGFEDLRDEDKQKVFEYRFVIRLLPRTPDATLRDIFQRLNRNNVALNSQELRQATYWGPFINTMNKISDEEYWSLCGIFTPNDVRRMLDVEFISELAVGVLHGLQNKKQSLDKWYVAYEREFEQQRQLETIVSKVMGELLTIIPGFTLTRWRKKSDFYTLFLVMAAHVQNLPLSSDQRLLAQERLQRFQEQVTEYIRTTAPKSIIVEESEEEETGTGSTSSVEVPEQQTYPLEVTQYAAAIQRAASDLGNRRARAKQIEAVLADVWMLGKATT